MRGFVLLAALGSVAPVVGCGSNSEEGTRVEVDKEQQAVMLEKMGNYMNKYGSPQKAKRALSEQAKAKKGE